MQTRQITHEELRQRVDQLKYMRKFDKSVIEIFDTVPYSEKRYENKNELIKFQKMMNKIRMIEKNQEKHMENYFQSYYFIINTNSKYYPLACFNTNFKNVMNEFKTLNRKNFNTILYNIRINKQQNYIISLKNSIKEVLNKLDNGLEYLNLAVKDEILRGHWSPGYVKVAEKSILKRNTNNAMFYFKKILNVKHFKEVSEVNHTVSSCRND